MTFTFEMRYIDSNGMVQIEHFDKQSTLEKRVQEVKHYKPRIKIFKDERLIEVL